MKQYTTKLSQADGAQHPIDAEEQDSEEQDLGLPKVGCKPDRNKFSEKDLKALKVVLECFVCFKPLQAISMKRHMRQQHPERSLNKICLLDFNVWPCEAQLQTLKFKDLERSLDEDYVFCPYCKEKLPADNQKRVMKHLRNCPRSRNIPLTEREIREKDFDDLFVTNEESMTRIVHLNQDTSDVLGKAGVHIGKEGFLQFENGQVNIALHYRTYFLLNCFAVCLRQK